MQRYEKTLFLSNNALLSDVTYWHGYVDDVLCLWEGKQSLAGESLILLNSSFPFIEFTMEVNGESINFLDFTIRINGDLHVFSVYRKRSTTDLIIDGRSFCP